MLYSLFAFFSAIGMVLSFLCHLLSWFHVEPPGGKSAFVLHIGIFVVWLPMIFFANRGKSDVGRSTLDPVQCLPIWARGVLSGVFVYALINFVLFIILTRNYPKNGVPLWLEYRGFSGHWMLFYSAALASFVGLRRRKQNKISGF